MTSGPGPFMTIRPGGPFVDAVVIVSVDGGEQGGKFRVEASWAGQKSTSRIGDYDEAKTLAHRWADQLATGIEPD
jgi:hypothetical protein